MIVGGLAFGALLPLLLARLGFCNSSAISPQERSWLHIPKDVPSGSSAELLADIVCLLRLGKE
jgi:hypothetical protein